MNKGYMQPYTDFSAGDNYYLDDPKPDPKPEENQPFDLGTMSVKGVTAPCCYSKSDRSRTDG